MIQRLFIGFILIPAILLAGTPVSFAAYSPTLSKEIGLVKQDVMKSRQQNGTGDWRNAWEKITQERGGDTPGYFTIMWNSVKGMAIQGATDSFLDGISLMFGFSFDSKVPINTCLRDDIWEVQALQEAVTNEMFKAALQNDLVNSGDLWKDFQRLQCLIDGSTNVSCQGVKGLKAESNDTKYWFPGNSENYYINCPFGEFDVAIDQLKLSINRLIDAFSGDSGFGSFNEMINAAKRRAVKRANDWIAANQIKVSLGGEAGANPMGLINDAGGASLLADLKTNLTQIEQMFTFVGMGYVAGLSLIEGTVIAPLEAALRAIVGKPVLIPLPDTPPGQQTEAYNVFQQYQKLVKTRDLSLEKVGRSLTFNLNLDFVSEQSLIDIEGVMVGINSEIKNAPKPTAIVGICEQVANIMKMQCKNKQPDNLPNCKE